MPAEPSWTDVANVVIESIGLIGVIFAVVTFRQTNKQNGFANVLACEQMVVTARSALADILFSGNDPKPHDAELRNKAIAERTEQYLNTIDRLCSAVLRQDIPISFRSDYNELLQETRRDFEDSLEPPGRYRNFEALYKLWFPSGRQPAGLP